MYNTPLRGVGRSLSTFDNLYISPSEILKQMVGYWTNLTFLFVMENVKIGL